MSRSKPIGWITAGTLLCIAGVAIACRLQGGSSVRAEAPVVTAGIVPPPPAPEPDSPPPPPSLSPLDEAPVDIQVEKLSKKRKPMPQPLESVPPPMPVTTPPVVEPPVIPDLTPLPPVKPTPPAPVVSTPPTPPTPPTPTPPIVKPVKIKVTPPRVVESVTPPAPPKVTLPKVAPPKVKLPRRPRVVETRLRAPVPPKAQVKTPWKKVTEAKTVKVTVGRRKDDAYIPPKPTAKAAPKVEIKQGPLYTVRGKPLTIKQIAESTLGTSKRWTEIAQLNPHLRLRLILPVGTKVRLPEGAQVSHLVPLRTKGVSVESEPLFPARMVPGKRSSDTLPVDHLPIIRANPVIKKETERTPLTGAFPCRFDQDGSLLLPEGVQVQLKKLGTVLITPGPDHCLWISTKDCTECVLKRVEKSYVNDDVVRAFKRLYFAQSEKTKISKNGRLWIPKKLASYADLGTDLMVIGTDDHFELWDAKRWYQYSLKKTSTTKPYGKNRTVIQK